MFWKNWQAWQKGTLVGWVIAFLQFIIVLVLIEITPADASMSPAVYLALPFLLMVRNTFPIIEFIVYSVILIFVFSLIFYLFRKNK